MSTSVAIAGQLYEWSEIAFDEPPSADWAHHGVAWLGDQLVTGVPSGDRLRTCSPSGGDGAQLPVVDTHALSTDPDLPGSIWVADPGRKFDGSEGSHYHYRLAHGAVLRVDVGGRVLQTVSADALPATMRDWRPCGVVAAGDRIWVADGYGHSLVHCFDRAGRHRWTSNGSASGMRFDTPHAIAIDERGAQPELLVADRANRRLVVLGLDGEFRRTVLEDELGSPSGLAFEEDRLWIAELHGSVVVADADYGIIDRFGIAERPEADGWPNAHAGGVPVRPGLRSGEFNSPHGIAVARDGRIAVSEWVIGGRLIVLTPCR